MATNKDRPAKYTDLTHIHTHKRTTRPPTTTTTAHILGRTWHPNKSVVTAGRGSWDLNACLVLIWTSSWSTVWWQRARFPPGRSCSREFSPCYLPLTFPSVVGVITKLHKGGGNQIPGLQQSIVHASVSWWMPRFLYRAAVWNPAKSWMAVLCLPSTQVVLKISHK